MAGNREVRAIGRLLESTPIEVTGADNLDLRGAAAVQFDLEGGATAVDYSWVRSKEASAHGYGETNITATPAEPVSVIGNFLRVVPTGGSVWVHLLA